MIVHKIVTDAAFGASKHRAISGVFAGIDIEIPEEKRKDATPLSHEAFYTILEKRIDFLKDFYKKKETKELPLFISVQKGFEKVGDIWHFTAIVGISLGIEGKIITSFARSIPLLDITDAIMGIQEEKSRYAAFEKIYPAFTHRAFIEIVSNNTEFETDWLKEAFRTCRYAVDLS